MKPYTTARRKQPPTPTVRGDFWEVDLRAWGFNWHYRLGPASLSEVQAIHAAYGKLDELRRASFAVPGAQLELQAGAPRTLTQAIDQWQSRKQYATDGGRRWGVQYAKALRAEIGACELQDMAGHAGTDRLLVYFASLASLAPATVRNRFGVLSQVLGLATERGWLAQSPRLPTMPPPRTPRFEWIDEPTFRAVRGALRIHGGSKLPPGETWEIVTERRRVFLSWLFYTGAHSADAGALTDEMVAVDLGTYIRRNTKSARVVADETYPMPEPLADDLRALLDLLGREAFYCGERFAAGPWLNINKVLQDQQRKLGIPGAPLTARILRRSFVRELARRGYLEREIADRAGHVDLTMIHQVYLRAPRPPGAEKSLWTRAAPGAPRVAHVGARVLNFKGEK